MTVLDFVHVLNKLWLKKKKDLVELRTWQLELTGLTAALEDQEPFDVLVVLSFNIVGSNPSLSRHSDYLQK